MGVRTSVPKAVAASAGFDKVFARNPRRVGLILSSPLAGVNVWSIGSDQNQGIALPLGAGPLVLTKEFYGERICEEVYGLNPSAGQSICATEIVES